MTAQDDFAQPGDFAQLLREARRQGVRWRVTPAGDLQAAGLPAELRPAVRQHRARLKARVRGAGCALGPAAVRWAYPPCADDWLAWTPGADRTHAPPGLIVAAF